MSVLDRLEAVVSPSQSPETPQTAGRHRAADAGPDVDAALSLLANERRRAILRFAANADGVFDINDVVDHVTAQEFGAEHSPSERKRVYVSLYQTHLSRFVDAGVLECRSEEEQTYRATAIAGALCAVLEAATTRFGGDA